MFPVTTEICGGERYMSLNLFIHVEIKNWIAGIAHPFRTVKQIFFGWHLL